MNGKLAISYIKAFSGWYHWLSIYSNSHSQLAQRLCV